MSNEDDDDYAVGYGRPPKGTRFKAGQSGNPSGKRKGARSLKADFAKELMTEVKVAEGGKVKRLRKQQIIVKALVSKAAQGNVPALAKALDLIFAMQSGPPDAAALGPLTDADDEAILAGYDWRRRQALEDPE